MKKLLIFGLALLFLCPVLFAEDAKVMPMMVGRFYVAPTYSFAQGSYDKEGEYESFDDGNVSLFNLGFALEYGIIDWITAAVQWVPGFTLWSDVEAALPAGSDPQGKVDANGVADLFVGSKIQIIGEKAPVDTGLFRLAIAPGVIIPLPGPDFEQEAKNLSSGKDATFSSNDKHIFAAGGRFYFDFVISKYFFINLYNETIFYPIKQDLNRDSPAFYATKGGMAQDPTMQAGLAAAGLASAIPQIMDIDGQVDYKYRLTFEIEPVLTAPIADGISFTVGVPFNYRYIPAYEYSFDYPRALEPASSMFKPILLNRLNTDPQHSLTVIPNFSFFFTKTFMPLEFKFQYGIPILGQNVMARQNITFQIKAYFALPGRPE
ncbi:MAG: hypothetical protein FWG99_10035 [Treponema sp.]|nr:hypothetical protein [Treponema sp.]